MSRPTSDCVAFVPGGLEEGRVATKLPRGFPLWLSALLKAAVPKTSKATGQSINWFSSKVVTQRIYS